MSWVSDGKAFKVHQPDQFVKKIVPLYFKQKAYKSFQRQLHLYGECSAFLPSRKIIHVRNIIHHLSPHLQFTIPCLTTNLPYRRLSTSERRCRKGIILSQVFCTRGSKFMPSNDSKDGQDRSQGCTGKEGFCFYRCYVQEEAQQDDDGKEPTSNRYSKSSSSSSATIYQVQQ